MAGIGLIVAIVIALCFIGGARSAQNLGKFLGKLSQLHHGVSGEVYAVDGRTLHIKDFTYDGQGPAAYFYASAQKSADKNGFRLRDENGNGAVIRRYRKEGVTLTLPEGKSLNSIKIFYVWCEEFDVNFGDVKIPRAFEYPRPQKIDPLKGVHAISSDNIVIVDAQTLLIPNLSYDGEAPDAKFWVGPGTKPTPQGIRVPDENGKELPLRKYDRKTVVLTLPGDLTIFDIGHFGIWCEQFTVDFGHVLIPQSLNIPPSLKMLGVSPQSKLNCEVLFDDLAFEVRWAVAGDSIVLQLVAKLDNREYMSFGLSGDQTNSVMIGGDVVVAWVDKQTLKGFAEDYYLADKAQCSGPTGSCPDNKLAENSNNIRLLNAAMVNGYSIVTYQRPLKASDRYDHQILTNQSQPIIWAIGPLNQRDEVSFHSSYLKTDSFLDFGRPAKWNCPMPESDQPPMGPVQHTRIAEEEEDEEDIPVVPTTNAPRRNTNRRRGGNRRPHTPKESVDDSEKSASKPLQQRRRGSDKEGGTAVRSAGSQKEGGTVVRAVPTPTPVQKRDAWEIPPIQCYEPEDGVFYAQMGPTGGKRGYPAITGHVGWGISWYINGLLIPEINVVRGKSYTFVVEGGLDPEVSAKYHPFYITDDPVGGYEYKTAEEKKDVQIYAGVRKGKEGSVVPTGTGRLCHWTQTGDSEADDFDSFGAYQRTLELKCDQGEPGVIQWTPDKTIPDTVYYQCFTHRYLGWKINVHDSCDEQPSASETKSVVVPAPDDLFDKSDVDLEESPSVRIETRVNPNNLFKEDKEDKAFKSAVSEKKIIPPKLDPLPTTEQPQEKLSNEPILIQAQQGFFDPFYQRNGAFLAQHTFQPNPFELPQQHEPNLHYFRPSTQLNTTHENTTPRHFREVIATFPVASSTTSTTTTTTAAPTTTEGKAEIIDNIVVSASYGPNETYLLPPLVSHPTNFNVGLRRPLGLPPGFSKRPWQFPTKMLLRPPNLTPMRQLLPQQMSFKKQIMRPPGKMPMLNKRPYNFPFENKPMFFSHVPPKRQAPPPFYVSQPAPAITRAPPIQNQMINNVVTETSKMGDVKNVEISPQQASTEREPEIQTAPSTSILDITPTFIRPAYNTGFRPGSVKIESGFKPIISKEFQDRMDRDEPDIEYESEMGVVNVEGADKYEFKPIQSFEPMFVPSPTDKTVKEKRVKHHKRLPPKKRLSYTKIVIKQPRSLAEFEEPVAEAAERVETYYLPPSDNRAKPVDVVRKPSNIDIEEPNIDSPPDVVVTYDGKRVSGQSLTAKLSDRSSILDQRVSKATEFIKAMPQFGKFKGELPPLNPEFIERNAPLLQSRAGVLNRDLDTPPLPSDSSHLPQGITRLSRVRKSFGDAMTRRKRAAHHTPEHTAQQAEESRRTKQTSSSGSLIFSLNVHLSVLAVAYLLNYL